ncbi:16S rRNA (guanine(527)-N(7))-methyltransferase RsmG [Halioxenophilus sp. WMMB6]|uniref:16S rRNA (guanine(527)-N(7))-methyltransferase RsmG n=1 Tax=Halioxenophilus sp. WMMB6 TaxID=3073815 RepID=UPI00295E3578|nr:16S rRNA (guanine(527)-N(7))-methyltransferase RsmG [Halioxenophilus sp. WMMB6]
MTQAALASALERGCQALELALTAEQQGLLLEYLQLFVKWNRAYNLSAVRAIEEMVGRHLLDSLSVLTYLESSDSKRFIDVGTGGGLPGIPLAICLPHWHWTLLDSNGKKTRFLIEVKSRLGLENVTVLNQRVETLLPEPAFDGVISRAFASLADMVAGCRHLLNDSGALWAMKGQFPEQELAELPADIELAQTWPLSVPGEAGQRHLLQLVPKNAG